MSLEEKKIKENRKSNVGRPPKRIDYHRIEYWGGGWSLEKLSRRRLVSLREVCESE